MSSARPTLSAIVFNYNHGAYLAGVLQSLAEQTTPFDQVVIVDDASTDDSVAVIQQYLPTLPNATLIQNAQNSGVNATANRGLEAATGDFIYYVSADDWYSNAIVQWFHQAVTAYPDIGMVAANMRKRNVTTGKEQRFILPFPPQLARYTPQAITPLVKRFGFNFYGGGNIMRRDAVAKIGGLRPDLKWYADWVMYLLLAQRHPFAVVPAEFAVLRQSDTQYSASCEQWPLQKPAIVALLRFIAQLSAEERDFFRNHALLPAYNLRILGVILTTPALRYFLTPLLVWRMLVYNPLRRVGRMLPDHWRIPLRRVLKL